MEAPASPLMAAASLRSVKVLSITCEDEATEVVAVKAPCLIWLEVKAMASSLLLSRVYVEAPLTSSNVNEPLDSVNLGGIRKIASRTSASGSVAPGALPVWVTPWFSAREPDAVSLMVSHR